MLKDNQIVWRKCVGLADLNKKIPITPITNFRLASLSKQFTAMTVMILVQRRKLNLEDKLTDFFSDYPAYGNQVTVRQLLSHTAGIPDHEKPLYKTIKSGDEPTMIDALEVLRNQPIPLFPPGSKYQYSDAGYVLLALIIEKVSGLSYRKFLQRNIFSPLGMTGSDVLDQTKSKIKNRAMGYKIIGKGFEVFDYDPLNYIVGDEGVYSSLEDMIEWSRAWEEEILVSRKTLTEAMTPAKLANGDFGKAGFSWLTGKFNGDKIVYQDGSWVGFRNIILKIPAKKLTAVILSNRTDLDSEKQRINMIMGLLPQSKL